MQDKKGFLAVGVVESLKSQGINLKDENEDLSGLEFRKVIDQYVKMVSAEISAEDGSLKRARQALKDFFDVEFE